MKSIAFATLGLLSLNGLAAPQLTPQGCHAYSAFVLGVAKARDSGKRLEDQLSALDRYAAQNPQGILASEPDLKDMFAAQIRNVYHTPKQSPEQLSRTVLSSCYQNEGRLGLLS
jgi:hypothetical protein